MVMREKSKSSTTTKLLPNPNPRDILIEEFLQPLWLSRNYPIGTALRMGTGYVPRLLCWILMGLGAVVLVQGLRETNSGRPGEGGALTRLWPILVVTASLVAFGLTLERLGLVVAIFLLIGFRSLALAGLQPVR